MNPSTSAANHSRESVAVSHVLFALPDGRHHLLYPGQIVGRLAGAGLCINNPHVSEAHCLLSLRGDKLVLLGLRAGFRLGRGENRNEVELAPGQRVLLTDDYELAVLDVVLPQSMSGLAGLPGGVFPLDRPEWSVYLEPLRIEAGARRDAAAWIWSASDGWSFQARDQSPRRLSLDVGVDWAGHELSLVPLEVEHASSSPTYVSEHRFPPIVVEIGPHQSTVAVEGKQTVQRIAGRPHELLRETAAMTLDGRSVHWTAVAERIWKANPTEDNFYKNRRHLRNASGLPWDLIATDDGQVRLQLRTEDTCRATFQTGASSSEAHE